MYYGIMKKIISFTKNVKISLIIFILLSLVTLFTGIKVVLAYLPTIQYFLNINSKPTAHETRILEQTGKKLTESENKTLFNDVKNSSKKYPYLEIAKCIPRPRVMHIEANTYLLVHNADSQIRHLSFGPDKKYEILPGETKGILVNFIRYVPAYLAYGCDSHPKAVGILYVTSPTSALQ